MSYTGIADSHRRAARERGKRWCDVCKEWRYVNGDEAALEEHRRECAGLYRYKCPVHGWRTLSRAAILRDHGQCDPTLTYEKFARMKPIQKHSKEPQ